MNGGHGDSERRRSDRIPVRRSVTIDVGDESFDAEIIDVAANGIAILAGSRAAPPRWMRIHFKLGPESGTLDVDGRVVRQVKDARGTVWGVQFHDLNLGTRTRLKDFVRRPVPPSAIPQ